MDVTHDAALGGRLRLTQPKRGHRFGHDAILLAAAVPAKPGDRVVEFGAGVGAAGLAVAARVSGIELILIEINPDLSALASANIAANGFSAHARALTLDVGAATSSFAAAGLLPGSADHVLMNPPFNDETLQASPDPLRRKAHVADGGTLPRWIESAGRVLRDGGMLTMIGRADGWIAATKALSGTFGEVVGLPIQSVEGEAPIRMIYRATKGARAKPAQLPVFILNDRERKPTAEAEVILRAGAALPF